MVWWIGCPAFIRRSICGWPNDWKTVDQTRLADGRSTAVRQRKPVFPVVSAGIAPISPKKRPSVAARPMGASVKMGIVAEQALPRGDDIVEIADDGGMQKPDVPGGDPAVVMRQRHRSVGVQHELARSLLLP
ncbi:hypothetical protein [Bifidobacterium avesanii]|uniref:Uncharacterized protein n=1 Tax=Bifidobacterium avesanii TaxID=1798157 RepID=A0A7K3TGF7_9BIFI|nr:hypothetical protein [Bifidobacterium avesanii]NEG78178.1 hypothetical protein [Bifidobacterium avesanii]